MIAKQGRQSCLFTHPPRVAAFASVAGPKEAAGPLGHTFDMTFSDDTLGQMSYERAEATMLEQTIDRCLSKARVYADGVDVFLCGDLLNQIVSAGYTARSLGIPFLGLYGACSTMAQSLLLGSMLIEGGFAENALCATCSHFSSAERQYRFPLELGNQRTPTAQWTVTGAGATLLKREEGLPVCITSATVGSVYDMQQKDANNMGAAMAPAAMMTLRAHLNDLGCTPGDYDLIVTGDLGRVGYSLMRELCRGEGIELDQRYIDCGCEIFSSDQDMHAGGSGCGCSACSLNGWLMNRMLSGEVKRMLFMATGALMSPTVSQQGETIPGIAHAVSLEVL